MSEVIYIIKCNIPVSVVTVFEPNNMPRPHKIKGQDRNANDFKLTIDVIRNIDSRSPSQIVYLCVSLYDGYEKMFELTYIIKSYEWRLSGL